MISQSQLERLEKLAKLQRDGALSQSEFDEMKADILAERVSIDFPNIKGKVVQFIADEWPIWMQTAGLWLLILLVFLVAISLALSA